jgi:hypothetical protein
MIVKKIPALPSDRRGGSARAKHVRALVDYMRSPEKENELREYLVAYMASQGLGDGPERLIHIGARNFVCEDLDGQRAEMMAVAQAAVRSQNPIDHWLLSWREGELPSSAEVDEAVAMFVEDLGLARHQCIYAVHGDTHNRHAHIALNRYDPGTGKVVTINKGFTREAAHKAVARIVHRFGWQPEREARYVMEGGCAVLSEAARTKLESGIRPLKAGAAALEVRTGYRSAQRIAQEDALPILLSAGSWPELHAALARKGIAYDPVGTNGAVLVIEGEGVRASDVSRKATIGAIAKRLGPFHPREAEVAIAQRDVTADVLPKAFRADEFRKDRARWRQTDRHERKRVGLRRPPNDLETWLHRAKEIWFAERWRNRSQPAPLELAFTGALSPTYTTLPEIDGYRAYRWAGGVRYARAGEGTAFVDQGARVTVLPGSDEALLAALRLSIAKFDGKVQVTGSVEFRKRTFDLAVRHGLADHVTNPEFVARREMQRRAAAKSAVVPVARRSQPAHSQPASLARERNRSVTPVTDDVRPKKKGLLAQAEAQRRPAEETPAVRSLAKGPRTTDASPTRSRGPGTGR